MNRRRVQWGLTATLLVLGASTVAFAQAVGSKALFSDSAIGPRPPSATLAPLSGDQAANTTTAAQTKPLSDSVQMAARTLTDASCPAAAAGVLRSAGRLASAGQLAAVPAGGAHLAARSGC
jgi:hypothetical protein